MHLTEESFEVDGEVFYKRTWRCSHDSWIEIFKWDDLDAASYIPVCGRCLGGTLQFS